MRIDEVEEFGKGLTLRAPRLALGDILAFLDRVELVVGPGYGMFASDIDVL